MSDHNHIHITVSLESAEERHWRNWNHTMEAFYSRLQAFADAETKREQAAGNPLYANVTDLASFWEAHDKNERKKLGFWRYYFT